MKSMVFAKPALKAPDFGRTFGVAFDVCQANNNDNIHGVPYLFHKFKIRKINWR